MASPEAAGQKPCEAMPQPARVDMPPGAHEDVIVCVGVRVRVRVGELVSVDVEEVVLV